MRGVIRAWASSSGRRRTGVQSCPGTPDPPRSGVPNSPIASLSVSTRGSRVELMGVDGAPAASCSTAGARSPKGSSRGSAARCRELRGRAARRAPAGIESAIELLVRARLEDPEPRRRAPRPARARRAPRPPGGPGRRPAALLADRDRGGRRPSPASSRQRTDAGPEELFDLFQQAFGIADEAMVSIAGGHRREPGAGGPGDASAAPPGPRRPARPALAERAALRLRRPRPRPARPLPGVPGAGAATPSDVDDSTRRSSSTRASSERAGLAAVARERAGRLQHPAAAARRAAADRDRPAGPAGRAARAPTGRPAGSSPPPRASASSASTT